MKKENRNTLTELFNNTRYLNEYINLNDTLKNNEIDNIDEFIEVVQERINEAEVIYYSEAMKLLNVHDTSLTISLSLASDFGYNTIDLNSELLATLLIQQILSEELSELIEEIEKQNIFND
ncbi:MAG: hypothetical protein ACOVK2_04800 [Candidatus Fonsibacter sp.]